MKITVEEAFARLGVTKQMIDSCCRPTKNKSELDDALVRLKEIAKSNWRKLVKQHHPDHGGDASKFNLIHEAWEAVKTVQVIERRPQPVVNIRVFTSQQYFYGSDWSTTSNSTFTW